MQADRNFSAFTKWLRYDQTDAMIGNVSNEPAEREVKVLLVDLRPVSRVARVGHFDSP